jgi:hypothetical protein
MLRTAIPRSPRPMLKITPTAKSLTFASNEGEGLCRDVESITLEINRGHRIVRASDVNPLVAALVAYIHFYLR